VYAYLFNKKIIIIWYNYKWVEWLQVLNGVNTKIRDFTKI